MPAAVAEGGGGHTQRVAGGQLHRRLADGGKVVPVPQGIHTEDLPGEGINGIDRSAHVCTGKDKAAAGDAEGVALLSDGTEGAPYFKKSLARMLTIWFYCSS